MVASSVVRHLAPSGTGRGGQLLGMRASLRHQRRRVDQPQDCGRCMAVLRARMPLPLGGGGTGCRLAQAAPAT